MNGVSKSLITQKIEKIQKKIIVFLKSLTQSFLKFNDPEESSKQLPALIKS